MNVVNDRETTDVIQWLGNFASDSNAADVHARFSYTQVNIGTYCLTHEHDGYAIHRDICFEYFGRARTYELARDSPLLCSLRLWYDHLCGSNNSTSSF